MFENWARTQRVLVPVVHNPTKVEHIVAAVLEAEKAKQTLNSSRTDSQGRSSQLPGISNPFLVGEEGTP
ncbi:hypothetical protein [Corallococcus llansteffanensis]|uniref:Uncharacterized protein n=1 Tax=Corallococcus llansteffanensis TaxID=2316731 RepID=A0A3A8QJX8_9BACT|nr:hypothetical protein [Corallococcus llansteffanensis]RKH69026.1 hypothetical protein D7V93_00455 [Corallococcus llansteffanensis]